jgi:hypothetical protein
VPNYDWWLLKDGAWKYLGRFKLEDWAGLWAQIQLVPEAQLFTRLAPPESRF